MNNNVQWEEDMPPTNVAWVRVLVKRGVKVGARVGVYPSSYRMLF